MDRGRGNSLRGSILLLLVEDSQHGYDLQPRIADLVGRKVDGSGVYRTLHRLEADGLVKSSWINVPGPGPRRRSYRTTAKGRKELDALALELQESARHIRRFLRRYAAAGGTGRGRAQEGAGTAESSAVSLDLPV
jgi:PadR family transcriptional regulator PadR